MKKEELILVGGGGHCASCIDVIASSNKFAIKGILDIQSRLGELVLGHPVIGEDSDMEQLVRAGYSFLITLGHTGNTKLRRRLFSKLQGYNANLPTIISPLAHVAASAHLGKGSIIMHNVLLNANSKVGENCIINNNALIEHDAHVGDHTHISTGAIINGTSVVGANCFIGSGSILRNNITVSSNSTIGMGSVVTSSIKHAGVYFGNPAKPYKINE